MNWTKALIAGVVAGVAHWIVSGILHGAVMAGTYAKFEVFDQGKPPMLMFLLVSVFIGITAALLFAKGRDCWGAGVKGGAVFGLLLGLAVFFLNFYNPLVIVGFPYFLSWCWGGIGVIEYVVVGIVLALIYK